MVVVMHDGNILVELKFRSYFNFGFNEIVSSLQHQNPTSGIQRRGRHQQQDSGDSSSKILEAS